MSTSILGDDLDQYEDGKKVKEAAYIWLLEENYLFDI